MRTFCAKELVEKVINESSSQNVDNINLCFYMSNAKNEEKG